MRRSLVVLGCLLSATLLAGGCDNGPDTSPTPPPTNPVTETFTGTVNLNGAVTHPFTATAAGQITATITTISPDASIVGFQMGTWNGVSCSVVVSNDFATLSSALTGITQSSANLCVRVHDPNGALTANPVGYTVTVSHP
jgi:hypothetical protein